jgi:L-histidine Nalpha-methyltransferase
VSIIIANKPITIDVHLGPDDWRASLRRDALFGLTSQPKTLPPTWLYDDTGSALYDEITRLPEYYPARTEQSILDRWADSMAALVNADTLVELGSGTSDKTRAILDAMARRNQLERYVPFDVAETTLRTAAESIANDYGIEVHGVVGDFRCHLPAIPATGRRVFAFLGGTIGNLEPGERHRMLADLSGVMRSGDSLLVGTDLVKDRGRLVRAYDDAAGVTAAFNKNVLSVLNNELGSAFDPDDFTHLALFDERNEWIEMRLRSRRVHEVDVPGLGVTIRFDADEEVRTEISAKFRVNRVVRELTTAGLQVRKMWTDPNGDFALTLAVRP